MSNLNSKKAETLGHIPTNVVKESSKIWNILLKNLWNYKILRTRYFSDNLKLAVITPVFEKRDPGLVENYKPLSVLPCVSKIFERIIQQ